MTEQTKKQESKENEYIGSGFTVYNKQLADKLTEEGNLTPDKIREQATTSSSLVRTVYVKKVTLTSGEVFRSIDVVDSDGKTHSATLNEPMSEEQREVNKIMRNMTPEQQKQFLEAAKTKGGNK